MGANGANAFDYVAQRAGVAPAFWGRYIGGRFAVTSSEAAFLHGKGARILVTYNGATDSPDSVRGTFAEGQNDAGKAASGAMALHIPAGVAIYADIEGSWLVNPQWLEGWVAALAQKKYAPGFYGDCTPTSPFAVSYCAARKANPALPASLLWSMEPELNSSKCHAGSQAPAYSPALPACGESAVLWQYSEGCWEDVMGVNAGVDMDLAMDAAMAVMW